MRLPVIALCDPHAFFRKEATAAPPPQRRVVAHVCPVEDAQAAIVKFNDAVFLCFIARLIIVGEARLVALKGIFFYTPDHLDRFGIKSKIAAHNAGAVIAMTCKIAERAVHAPEQT